MGIWNCDKLMNMNDLVYREVAFNFKQKIDSQLNKINIHVIYLDNNSVIEYSYKNWKKIGFVKSKKMQIKLIKPGGKLIIIDEKVVAAVIGKGEAILIFDAE
jgi:hypothetical protein